MAFPKSCLRCLQTKRIQGKVICLLFLWLFTFQILVLKWLHEEGKHPAQMFWFFTKNLTGTSRQLTTAKTNTQTEELFKQSFVFLTHQSPTAVVTKLSDFSLVDFVSKLPHDTTAKYIVIIPHINKKCTLGLDAFEQKDKGSLMFLAEMLNSLEELDGATCISRGVLNETSRREMLRLPWREIFLNSSWCNFARREWSIQIRNRGPIKVLRYISSHGFHAIFQTCNIINGPVVLRKEKFVRIGGLNSTFGRLTLLEFFLRSKGRLKIGKFGNCILSEHLIRTDRGVLQESGDFPEYSRLATKYGIFRIIKEDGIEWTKCAASGRLCKERPYIPPTTLPQVGQPICCSVLLGKMLKDVTEVLVKLGIEYRLVYGTLLGAVRSKAIIPWNFDVDISLKNISTQNNTYFNIIQTYLKDRYYVGEYWYMPRVIPLMPAHIDIKTAPFFDGDNDIRGDMFFSPEIIDSVQELMPEFNTSWRTRGYLDFYSSPEIWWNGSSVVEIDGHSYVTFKEIDYELRNWYGDNYMKPTFEGNWVGLSDKDAITEQNYIIN